MASIKILRIGLYGTIPYVRYSYWCAPLNDCDRRTIPLVRTVPVTTGTFYEFKWGTGS
jgi:hypothetical protein